MECNPAFERAKIPKITFQDLRHAAINHQIQDGTDIVFVGKVAGHLNLATTLRIYGLELGRS